MRLMVASGSFPKCSSSCSSCVLFRNSAAWLSFLGLASFCSFFSFGVFLEGELRGALVEVDGFLYLRLGPSSSSSCSAADSDPDDRLVRLRLAAGLALARFVAAELDSAATSNDSRDGDGFLGIGGSLVLADLRGFSA